MLYALPINESMLTILASPMPNGGARLHALKLGVFGSLFYSFCCPLPVSKYTVPEVHATGSTVRLASKITEMSNRYVVTPTSSYVNIVTVGNVGDDLHVKVHTFSCNSVAPFSPLIFACKHLINTVLYPSGTSATVFQQQ